MPRPFPYDRVLKDRLEEVLGCSLRSKQLILGVVESLVFWEGQSLWQKDLGQLKLAQGREARETESSSSSWSLLALLCFPWENRLFLLFSLSLSHSLCLCLAPGTGRHPSSRSPLLGGRSLGLLGPLRELHGRVGPRELAGALRAGSDGHRKLQTRGGCESGRTGALGFAALAEGWPPTKFCRSHCLDAHDQPCHAGGSGSALPAPERRRL